MEDRPIGTDNTYTMALQKKADDRDALILFIREYFKRHDLEVSCVDDELGMGVIETASDDMLVEIATALTSIMISVSNIRGILSACEKDTEKVSKVAPRTD